MTRSMENITEKEGVQTIYEILQKYFNFCNYGVGFLQDEYSNGFYVISADIDINAIQYPLNFSITALCVADTIVTGKKEDLKRTILCGFQEEICKTVTNVISKKI